MVRILHMIGSLDIGGSQAMIMNLYRKIDRGKIQFDFILDHPDQLYFAEEIKALGGKLYFLPTFERKNIAEVKNAWNQFFNEHPEYKILHSHVRSYASIYIPIAKKYGLKTIIHSHSTSNGKGFSAVIKAIMQYPLRYQADYFMACSDIAGKWLFGAKVVHSSNYMVVPNAIDVNKFAFNEDVRKQIRRELNIDDKYVLGHVGRMTEPKNHDFLLDVFSELIKLRGDSMLLLVGDGELRSSIVEKAKKLGIEKSIIILGNKSNTYDYYQAMDLFVFPSLWEGLGIVAIEAQAAGLHCVVSERIPEEINVGANLVKVLKLSAGAEYWAKYINNIYSIHREGQINAVRMAGFDISDNVKKIEKFYLELI